MLTENFFTVEGAEIWVYNIKIRYRDGKSVLTKEEGVIYGDIGFSAAVMSCEKCESFEFQRKSPPFYIIKVCFL